MYSFRYIIIILYFSNFYDLTIAKKCKHNQFNCLDKSGCFSIFQKCDGISHCRDSTDERYCTTTTPPCSIKLLNRFYCDNMRKCIHKRYLCNGIKDCLDSSDEFGCTTETRSTTTKTLTHTITTPTHTTTTPTHTTTTNTHTTTTNTHTTTTSTDTTTTPTHTTTTSTHTTTTNTHTNTITTIIIPIVHIDSSNFNTSTITSKSSARIIYNIDTGPSNKGETNRDRTGSILVYSIIIILVLFVIILLIFFKKKLNNDNHIEIVDSIGIDNPRIPEKMLDTNIYLEPTPLEKTDDMYEPIHNYEEISM